MSKTFYSLRLRTMLLPFGVMTFALLMNGGANTGKAFSSVFGDSVDLFGSCDIKGNVSHKTGQKIYHLPHQKYYDETMISTRRGERYFCSEAEAVAAGWRKSRV